MTLANFLDQSAKEYAHKTALLFRDHAWSFSDLRKDVLKSASGFAAAGVNKGDRVLILCKNCPEFVIAALALTRLGAIAVPLNFYLKPEEIAYSCNDCAAKAIVTQTAFLSAVRQAQPSCPTLKTIWITDAMEAPAEPDLHAFNRLLDSPPLETAACSPKDTALILYTSGTTGVSKGVMLSHANLTSNADASIQALDLKSSDRFMCILPMFHVFAWTANVLVPLRLGCPLTIVDAIRPPTAWLKLMGKNKITIFAAVPQIYAVLAEQATGLKRWIMRFLFFRHVRIAISGAAPLQVETLEHFQNAFNVPLIQGYGLTETSPVAAANHPERNRPGTVGRAIPGVRLKIIDENENAVPAGKEGEICIAGDCIMQGYYNRPEDTKAAFTKDGWFKTGDVGTLSEDGYLSIHDRIKDMIIVKGLKVFSAQIETILLTHPAVAEAAVIGVPTHTGDEIVRAFVVAKTGVTLDKNELMSLCREKLPPYKRPRDIELRAELPKNSLQKVLKRELRAQAMAERS